MNLPNRFMFATGIENSYPIIPSGQRLDEMAVCGHYKRWREDLALTRELGIDTLRIGPAYYLIHEAPGKYAWDLFDEVVEEMRRLEITPIVDLLHFGVPEWLGSFQNPELALHFADYAGAFARRYPDIRWYTPVNEILIAARFSARYGWWNERLAGDTSYVRALLNLTRANLMAMHAIRAVRPDALMVQTESFEYWHAEEPSRQPEAALENQIRFVPMDLTFGVTPGELALKYLLSNGCGHEELEDLSRLSMRDGCIIGIDYYITSEHTLTADGPEAPVDDTLGLAWLAAEAFQRYGLPLMHTETNRHTSEAVVWLRKQWLAVLALLDSGVPIVGFTWFSLTDQMDWDSALREHNMSVCPIGLADLDRKLHPVGAHYRDLIRQWRHLEIPAPRGAATVL